jgi:hypothetical protein
MAKDCGWVVFMNELVLNFRITVSVQIAKSNEVYIPIYRNAQKQIKARNAQNNNTLNFTRS